MNFVVRRSVLLKKKARHRSQLQLSHKHVYRVNTMTQAHRTGRRESARTPTHSHRSAASSELDMRYSDSDSRIVNRFLEVRVRHTACPPGVSLQVSYTALSPIPFEN